jgi:6-phosphogluconolactonase
MAKDIPLPKDFTAQKAIKAIIALTILAIIFLALALVFIILWNNIKPSSSSSSSSTTIAKTSYIYVPGSSNVINVMKLAPTTGALTFAGSNPIFNSVAPIDIVVIPKLSLSYVLNAPAKTVGIYSLNTTNGGINFSSTFSSTGNGPTMITTDITGSYLLVTNATDGTISSLSISPTDGTLTAVSGSPFASTDALFLTFHSSNSYCYATNQTGGKLLGFGFNAITGALTPLSSSPYTVGATPIATVFDNSNRFIYCCNSGDGTISGFSIATSTGALTPLNNSPYSSGSSSNTLNNIAMHPILSILYCCTGNGLIVIFNIATDGSLSANSFSPFTLPSGTTPTALAIDPSGSFLYINDTTHHQVLIFTIGQGTGALLAGSTPSFATFAGSTPNGLTLSTF